MESIHPGQRVEGGGGGMMSTALGRFSLPSLGYEGCYTGYQGFYIGDQVFYTGYLLHRVA